MNSPDQGLLIPRDRRHLNATSVEEAERMARSLPTIDSRTAALLVGVGEDSMYAAAKRGQFGAFKVSGRYRLVSRLVLAAVNGTGAGEVAA